ncbi:MAG: preprotein translocase subunit YajC [Butyricicoccus sp.]|nr:preprotein translocase subunit YajC [Butyricicoccus sp.]
MNKKTVRVLCLVLVLSLACLTMTGCAPAGDASAAGAAGGASAASSIIMLVVLIAVFYFFMIRPENKRKKKLEQMRNELGVGDKITTIGGMVGKIVDISGDLITFETGEDRVRIQVTKWAISTNNIQKEEAN